MMIGVNVYKGTRLILRLQIGGATVNLRCSSPYSTATLPHHNPGTLNQARTFSFSWVELSDYSPYLQLLQLCIDAKAKRHGVLTHGHLIVNGFSLNAHLNTKLIIFYSKMGDMMNARKVSDRMLQRSVVSWTALISGYSQDGKSEESLRVFSEMHKQGVKCNQYTYGSALRACTDLLCLDRGTQIQGLAQKGRFVENMFVQSALVDLYSKCGKVEDAFCMFTSTKQRDLVSWNAIIGGFTSQGFHDNAFSMFRLMLRDGLLPDHFTFGSLLRASIDGGGLFEVGLIHNFIIQLGFESHNKLIGSLVDAYVKCGSIDNADHLYKNVRNKDIISCTALVTGYAREGMHSCKALELFNEIRRMHVRIDNVILCSMLSICANTASLCLGKQLHSIVLKYQIHLDVAIGNALIDMYSKSGDIQDATRIFYEMEEKNIITWTTLICGLGRNGYGNDAVSLYKKMEGEGLKPNGVTLLSLLSACSHNGLTGEGLKCFYKLVSNHNISPKAEHYSCLVDLFARGGHLEQSYDLVCNMNIKPNASLWSAILGACSIYGDMSLGEMAARHLAKIEPENSANYVVISGMYANAGLWDSSRKARKSMEQKSLLKTPGCSYFESHGKTIALLSSG